MQSNLEPKCTYITQPDACYHARYGKCFWGEACCEKIEIPQQLTVNFSHYLQGFNHPRWCRTISIHNMRGCSKNKMNLKKNEWNETCNNKLVVTMIIWFPLLASPIEPKFIFNNYKYWKNKLWCLLPMKIPTSNQISEQRWISQNFVLLRGQKQFSHEHKWIRNFSQSVTIGGCRAFHNTKTNNVANKIVTTLFENNWVFSEIQTPWHLLKRGCTCQYDPIWPIFVHCHSICIVPSSKNCRMVQLF